MKGGNMKRLRILVVMFVVVSVAVGGTAAAQTGGPNAPEAAITSKFRHDNLSLCEFYPYFNQL
jgi:hypothetical protein